MGVGRGPFVTLGLGPGLSEGLRRILDQFHLDRISKGLIRWLCEVEQFSLGRPCLSFPRSVNKDSGPPRLRVRDTMGQPESRLSRQIMSTLKARGFFCFKVHGSEYMMAGLPDIIVCADGLFIGLETKVPGKEYNTSARQEFVHTQIQQAGGIAQVVSSVDEAVRVVGEALRAAGLGGRRHKS